MQNLENDIDDLLRKAVDHYSLKLCESEWNQLATRLTYKTISFSIISRYFTFKKRLIILFCLLTLLICVMAPTNSLEFYKVLHATILLNDTNVKSLKLTAFQKQIYSINESFVVKSNRRVRDHSIQNAGRQYSGNLVWSRNRNYNQGNLHLAKEILQIDMDDEKFSVIDPVVSAVNPLPLELSNHLHLPGHTSLQKLVNAEQRGFYYGVVLGPLWSQVRHYEFTKAGFDFGIIIGYKLSRKISVETGLLSTKEYYVLAGKNNSGTSGLSQFDSLQGSREALQISANINYHIIQTKSANIFLSAGLTSYVGIDEKIRNRGGNSPMPSGGSDSGFANYLPSYLNIGIGCEFRVGKLANVRIGPYSQIPLKSTVGNTINLGIGKNLQFFNAGLRIGITRFMR